MKILVVNCGSSSLKYQLVEMDGEEVLVKGLVERIGIHGSKITHKKPGFDKVEREVDFPTHTEAIRYVFDMLVDPTYGAVQSLDEIAAAGHRIVQGGWLFSEPVVVTEEVVKGLEELIPFAPLHNPAHIQGIRAVQAVLPSLKNVVVFDTAFHSTMPVEAYAYGLEYKYLKDYHIRKYGFHGTSHDYVSHRAAEILGKDIKDLKIVTAHLGNGSSLTAVKDGICIDTSMGFAPHEGVVMGTRCGDIDGVAVVQLAKILGGDLDKTSAALQKQGGLLGLSGISSDLRDVEKAAAEGNERAQLAQNKLLYGVRKYIGSYMAAMNGLDVLVFTAGIGENGIEFRQQVCDGLTGLGIKVDPEKNNCRGKEVIISTEDSPVTVMVIPTEEEMMIARQTKKCIEA